MGLRSFLPHYREIDEQREAALYAETIETSSFNATYEKKQPVVEITQEVDLLAPKIQWEIRDEANRSWFRAIFDEYEYKPKILKDQKFWQWFSKEDTREERILVTKLDFLICLYSFAMYFVKYLDQANISNAYVSGMKEDLGMKGNDLVVTQIVYIVGAIVFQIPFMFMISKFPTLFILPALDLGWGMFTLAIYRAHNVRELQAYRFFVGCFESAFYPTVNYIFGSWYKPTEYSRRAGFYYCGQFLGVLTAGLLQSTVYKNLNGTLGLAGWRWMFIISAIITIPVGIVGFFLLPGTPSKCYSLFLTDREIYLSRKRMRDANVALESNGPKFYEWKLWKKILSDWRYVSFVTLIIFMWNSGNSGSSAYILWLKSLKKYSIPLINQYSAITPALGIIYVLTTAYIADNLRSRFAALMYSYFFNILGNVLLSIWHLPQGVLWFAFCLQYYATGGYSVINSWASDATRSDPTIRAITTVSMNMLGQTSTLITMYFVWPTVDAPRYLVGFTFTTACAVCCVIMVTIILIFYKRDERRNAHLYGILLYNSKNGELPPEIPTSDVSSEENLQ